MATRLKTIEYWFNEIGSLTDATDTNFTQITVSLPESSKTFVRVMLECQIQDAEATANNVSRRQLSISVNGATYTAYNNTNAIAASAEQKWIGFEADVTAHFTTNYIGTSHTVNAMVLCDSAIATPVQGWRNATARLIITYTYDDTSSTQIKTVRWPLNAPIGNLATTKPGTATATIPAFDTELPEAGKTIRQITLVVQGNDEYAGTTDHTLSWEIDTGGAFTTTAHEAALNTSCWYRHCRVESFTTNATHDFFLWSSVANKAHPQAYLNITYEYNEASTTSVMNSVLLGFDIDSGQGYTTTSDPHGAEIEYWINEPGTITKKASAMFYFWQQNSTLSAINVRVNSGSYSGTLLSTATTVAGSCGAMFRCEGDITLARGKNTITTQVYSSSNTAFLSGLGGYLMLNYTSGKASGGTGAHNATVIQSLLANSLTSAAGIGGPISTAQSIAIPETNYFINSVMGYIRHLMNGTNGMAATALLVERLSGEGGVRFESMWNDWVVTDSLVGLREFFGEGKSVFRRWSDFADTTKLDIETNRRYRGQVACTSSTGAWMNFGLYLTYHSITSQVSGTISGSAGGTVQLRLLDATTFEVLQTKSRTGDGTYTFDWFDDTRDVIVLAVESDSLKGASKQATATTGFDIALANTGGGEFGFAFG